MSLPGETLASVLTARNVAPTVLPEKDREQPITSFAVSSDDGPFLLAYYDDDGSGTLRPPLHVLRYDRQTKRLLRADLHGSPAQFHGFDEVMSDIPNETCLGSALQIYEKNGFIVIDTHINPSAGCILILTPDLKFSAALWGWTLGQIDGNIIYELSMVHFASIHAARIAVYNARLKQRTLIYPAPSDPARKQFSNELKKHLPAREFCIQQNLPCDPANFSTDIQHVIVSNPDHSFAFEAQMTPEGFGTQAENLVAPQTASYKFHLEDRKWVPAANSQTK
jgi:hypothetical protein